MSVKESLTDMEPLMPPPALALRSFPIPLQWPPMEKARSPEEFVRAALEEAERLRRSRQYARARDLLLEALQHGVEVAQIYFRLGNVLFDEGQLEKAEYAYKRAIEHDPHHVNAHHNLAVVYRRQGRFAEAVKQRRKAHRLAFKYPQQVALDPEQVSYLRRYARRFLFIGLGLLLLLFLGLSWLLR